MGLHTRRSWRVGEFRYTPRISDSGSFLAASAAGKDLVSIPKLKDVRLSSRIAPFQGVLS